MLLEKLKVNFDKRFWNNKDNSVADRISAEGLKDDKIRPNALMTLTVPLGKGILERRKEAHKLMDQFIYKSN